MIAMQLCLRNQGIDHVTDGDSRTGRASHGIPEAAWLTLPCSGTMNLSQESEEVLNVAMSTAVFWLVSAAILLGEGAIIVAALKMRVEPDPSRGILGSRPFEILWTLLPLTLVALMLVLSYGELQDA
jgi:heme/copper-type cytochrome/quinol oxidase subunit 2